LDEEIDSSEAHDWVIREVLVADEEPSDGIESELPIVESRGDGVEELGGDGENRDVLQIWIVVEAVASEVMSIVRPFPPRYRDSGEAVAGDKLSDSVVRFVRHDDVVARVVTYVSALDPEETEESGGDLVSEGGGAGQNAVENAGEHGGDEG